MVKHSNNPNPEQPDIGLPSTAVQSGPVECLGMTFPSDTERRKYFLEKLAKKLKDPEFRMIEGFPIGEDEDILALSDPPYYTACPNPWLADFVKHYAIPYNPKDKYRREPFATDVNEGKNHPIYNAHSYHTKVPHRAIMRYILHYTKPGDLVFDGFAGTGMTGIAAQFCGDKEEVQALGYRVLENGEILDETGKPFSRLGTRRIILNDLSPAASFIAYNYNTPVDIPSFEREAKRILINVQNEFGWMYEVPGNATEAQIVKLCDAITKCKTSREIREIMKEAIDDGIRFTKVIYNVWSAVYTCNNCGADIPFWNPSKTTNEASKYQLRCGACGLVESSRRLSKKTITIYDPILGQAVVINKYIPALTVSARSRTGRLKHVSSLYDITLANKIEELWPQFIDGISTFRMPEGSESRRNDESGITHTHQFYTHRNLAILNAVSLQISQIDPLSRMARFLRNWFNSSLSRLHRGNRYAPEHDRHVGPMANTLYISPTQAEISPFYFFAEKITENTLFLPPKGGYIIQTGEAERTGDGGESSVDYIFVDPPFGANIMYSELNFINESWLKVFTNNRTEAVVSETQRKNLSDYQALMRACFTSAYRLLKPGHWITVEFSNSKASVWNTIQTALQEVGFVISTVTALNKGRGGLHGIIGVTAVKQDLVISAYKPNGGLESRFAKKAETEDGVWDFIRTHLGNLPVVKPRGGLLEPIMERDPRILFDRTVAFYVRHSIPVPISSPEFQSGLAEKFPERDGMYFLSDQAAEYDKVRMKMEGIGQLTLFVEDERSAVAWLRNYLKNKPCKYQDIQPEFFEQLNQSWKKWETRPELRALLDQYFLCYSGEGDIPPQIHSYLSTNFKELRNLPADHAMLRAKARDRWFVPDPRKNADVEQLREKRLLEEFWAYMPPGYEPVARRKKMQAVVLPGLEQTASKLVKGKRIAIVRTEAVRVGFNYCFGQNDYQTIIAVARHIPEDVIQNDEQLQMIYDSAVTRTGGEFE